MNKSTQSLLSLLFLFFFSLTATSQTLVNQTVLSTFTNPARDVQYVKVIPNGSGGFVALMDYISTYNSQENYQLLGIDSLGNPTSPVDYNALNGTDNFGTNLYAKNGYAYAIGFTTDSAFDQSLHCTLMKINASTMDTIWTVATQLDSAVNQMPFALIVDNSDNVYVGASVQTPTSYKMAVAKYDPTGALLWEGSYDTTGRHIIPVAMTLSPTGAVLGLTGFSYDSFGHYDYVTADFGTSTGHMTGHKISANGIGAISRPAAIASDTSYTYVFGTVAVTGGGTVMGLIKYDSAFNQVFVLSFGDSSKINTAGNMVLTSPLPPAHIYMTGTVANDNGGTDLILLDYNTDGSLVRSSRVSAPNPHYAATGKDLVINTNDFNGNNYVYVTGNVYNGSDTDLLTVAFDTAGQVLWKKTYNRGSHTNESALNIFLDGDGSTIYVSATSYGSDSTCVMMKYEQFMMDGTAQLDSNSQPLYFKNQVVVKFRPSLVNLSFVENKDIKFDKLSNVVPSSVVDAMNKKIGYAYNFGDVTATKLFVNRTPTDSTYTDRYGNTQKYPTYWSVLLLNVPVADLPIHNVKDSLNLIMDTVDYAELNLIVHGFSYPNDPQYTNGSQPGLCPTGSVPDADVNACNAWPMSTGNAAIKIGIYDTGIKSDHEDFQITLGVSKAASGYDYGTSSSSTANDQTGHGTATAGVCAALSNNTLGGAGMAGGDGGSNSGCTLHNVRLTTSGNTFLGLAQIAPAVVDGASNTYPDGTSSGLDIMNHSWGGPDGINDNDLNTMRDAVRGAFHNGVKTIAAAGNYDFSNPASATVLNYPASFKDDWVIKVGGSGSSGDYSNVANYSDNMDCMAPAAANLSLFPSILANNAYDNAAQGTSLAAPYVSGTVGLMMSYLKDNGSPYFLEPYDAERLIELYATDLNGSGGYDNFQGWGRLNAGNVMTHIVYPQYKIRRFFGTLNTSNTTQIGSSVSIAIPYHYGGTSTSVGAGTYVMDVYKGTLTFSHSLASTEHIITTNGTLHAWATNSMSDFLGLYTTTGGVNTLIPESDVVLSSISDAGGTVTGYIYHITADANNNAMDVWLPYDMTSQTGYLAYGLHTKDDALSVNNIENDETSILYPNPASDFAILKIISDQEANSKVKLVSLDGKILLSENFKINAGTNQFTFNLAEITDGLYNVYISSALGDVVKKLIVCKN